MLALECELIKEYIYFQKNQKDKYDKETIIKLFKYLQLPFKMSVEQKIHIDLSDEIVKSLADSNIIRIRNYRDENALINATKLKIMLSKDRNDGTYPYPYINILEDETDISFTATYRSGESRDKAKEHIKALLEDASFIKIYDRYLSKINNGSDSWSTNKQILLDILPQKTIQIDIYCQSNWDNSRETDLAMGCTLWTINKQAWDYAIHDRFIETDKVIILLSSGMINLSNTSTKDFTYIVKLI